MGARIPVIIENRYPVNRDIVFLDALFAFNHDENNVFRKIRMTYTFKISEACPFASVAQPAINLKSPRPILDNCPQL